MHAAEFFARLAGIVVLDLLLSGDNAVVIALVCRDLPGRVRDLGMVLGTVGAVLARVVMSFFAAYLISLPGLRLVGGALLLWVACGLLDEEESDEPERPPEDRLFVAVMTVVLADASMSLDNVVALAALSHGNVWLMGLGVTLSIPLVVVGARIVASVIDRWPALVWGGAALLGWVAGGIVATDPWVVRQMHDAGAADRLWWFASILSALIVLVWGATCRASNGSYQDWGLD